MQTDGRTDGQTDSGCLLFCTGPAQLPEDEIHEAFAGPPLFKGSNIEGTAEHRAQGRKGKTMRGPLPKFFSPPPPPQVSLQIRVFKKPRFVSQRANRKPHGILLEVGVLEFASVPVWLLVLCRQWAVRSARTPQRSFRVLHAFSILHKTCSACTGVCVCVLIQRCKCTHPLVRRLL